jgi:hypothetical protein
VTCAHGRIDDRGFARELVSPDEKSGHEQRINLLVEPQKDVRPLPQRCATVYGNSGWRVNGESGHTCACNVTSLSAAFSKVSIFLQNANLVTDRPNSGRE